MPSIPEPLTPPKERVSERTTIPAGNDRKLKLFTLLILAIALAWLIYYLSYARYREYTDDGYVNGNKVTITTTVPGAVIALYADDTDLVEEGQLLLKLDDTDSRIIYEKELATLAATVLQLKQLYDDVRVREEVVKSKRIAFENAQYDYTNRAKLVGSKAIANEDVVHSKNDLLTAQSTLDHALAELQRSIDAVGTTPLEKHPLLELQKNVVRHAYYTMHNCHIFAPTRGYVAQRNVNVGQWVRPGDSLLAVIPNESMWVDANYKETQVTHLRIGQPAEVRFDLYGSDIIFKGKVLGIASGTGSVFSLIPPQNATGNWIKIVQRLPVRISLDSTMMQQYPLRLGISAEVTVDITHDEGERLALLPQKKAISTTSVFNLDLQSVDAIIDGIIHETVQSSSRHGDR